MLTKTNFKCQQCGDCCRLVVKLSNDDIKRIEKAGHKKESFLAQDPMEPDSIIKDTLKRMNNRCIFSYHNDNKYWCAIYKIRPENCRIFPFFNNKVKTCNPEKLLKWW